MIKAVETLMHGWRGILVTGVVGAAVSGCAGAPPGPQYVPDSSYHLLMAEIALQRQQYLTAAQEYLSVAERSGDPELAQRAAEFSFDYGLDVYALRAARRWEELAPDDVRSHEMLARLYLRRSKLVPALHHAELALGPTETRSDENYLAFAADLAGEEDAAAVTTLLTRLRGEHPESAGLQFAIAQAALRSGADDLALVFARQIAAEAEDSRQADLLIARAHVAAGDSDLGLAYLETRLRENPSLSLELEYVRLLGLAGRAVAAIEALNRLSNRYGSQPEFVRMHALISYGAGDLDTAARDFNDLLSDGSNVYECFYYLGRIASLRDNHRESIRFFTRIGGGPYHVAAQVEISRAYDRLGDPQTALNHLAEFASTYPRNAYEVIDAQAALLRKMDRDDEALRVYESALQFKPDSVHLLISRGDVLEQMGRFDEAVAAMERAVRLAPASALTRNSLGYTLTNRTRRQREAYRHIRLAIELEPESPPIIDSMGWVLFRTGRYDAARAWLELAYNMLPDPEVAAHLGEVLWVTGERDAARAIWEDSLANFPDSEPLNETMTRLMH